jgi:hypothetical protein
MSRISFTDTDGTLRWFDPDAAQAAIEEGQDWNGQSWLGVCSGLRTTRACLYLTSGGRWIENVDSSNEHNGRDRYRYLTQDEARAWLIKSADASRHSDEATKALASLFPDIEEESGPSVGGRPKVGAPINIAFPADLLARVDEAAARSGLTRAAWLRQVAAAAVADSEQRAANPTA